MLTFVKQNNIIRLIIKTLTANFVTFDKMSTHPSRQIQMADKQKEQNGQWCIDTLVYAYLFPLFICFLARHILSLHK